MISLCLLTSERSVTCNNSLTSSIQITIGCIDNTIKNADNRVENFYRDVPGSRTPNVVIDASF
jgi:hypothetical protein